MATRRARSRIGVAWAAGVATALLAACQAPAPMVAPSGPVLPVVEDELDADALADALDDGDGSDAAPGGVGAEGMGDPYYPEAGNGGYQVAAYDLAISYDPATNALSGVAELTVVVTAGEPLTSFHLDLQTGMTVGSVTVDGVGAEQVQEGAEVVVTPEAALEPDATAVVEVAYDGEPNLIDTGGLGDGGWYRTEGGGALAAGEPFSASAWFPVNEHPADAAIYRVAVTVPEGYDVISNGREVGAPAGSAPDGMHTVIWEMNEQIASYLVTVWIDPFERYTATTPDGIEVVSAAMPDNPDVERLHGYTPEAMAALVELIGPYPYDAVGGIFVDEDLPFALETATRPIYAPWANEDVVVHEIAHQWYGNLVRPDRWADICISECLASYSEWLVSEAGGALDVNDLWSDYWAYTEDVDGFWENPLVDMGRTNEFTAVYDRGPMALHVLRLTMGDDAFMELLQRWPAENAEQSATFDEFVAMAQSLVETDLQPVVDVWFRGEEKPGQDDIPDELR